MHVEDDPLGQPRAEETTPLLGGEVRAPAMAAADQQAVERGRTPHTGTDTPAADSTGKERERSPVSTLNRLASKFGSTDLTLDKAGPMAKKIGWGLGAATWKGGKFVAKQAINWRAVTLLFPMMIGGASTRDVAGKLVTLGWQGLMNGEDDSDVSALAGGDSNETVVAKGVGKTVKFNKFHELIFSYIGVFADAKLGLQDNARRIADGIEKEEKRSAFVERHPEMELPLLRLRQAIDDYKPGPKQTRLDADIMGLLLALVIAPRVPRLPEDSLKAPFGIFKTLDKRKQFDAALKDVLGMAKESEVKNTSDISMFHERWRNLTLSDKEEMPFMRLSGEGATDFAKSWCGKVEEMPIEVDADDLVELMTGSRHKDAKPRVPEKDPSPVKQLGGFYSRVDSGNPTSPIVVTGFDAKRADHASLIPLLQGASKISFPYKDIPGLFSFNLKGVAVFLCEEESATNKKVVEVPAEGKAAADGKGKDKEKAKGKNGEEKAGKGDKAEKGEKADKGDKTKDKNADGDKTNSKGFELLTLMPRAELPPPSEQRRRKKFDDAMQTTVAARLDLITQDEDPVQSEVFKRLVKDVVSRDAFKNLFIERSAEKNVSLKQAEAALLYFAEHVAATYRGILAMQHDEEEVLPGPSTRDGDTERLDGALKGSADEVTTESEFKAFVENYFERFEKKEAPKSPDDDGKTPSSLDLAALDGIDMNELAQAFPKPLWAQPREKGQTTLEKYFQPKKVVLSPLLEAATTGDLDKLREQIDSGECDLNATDGKGNSALHLAVQGGHIDVARVLLKAGIDVNSRNKADRTAMDLAFDRNNSKMAKLILRERRDSIQFDD